MIKNIVFDWSGTLVDDLPSVWEATNHVFRQAGIAEITLERFRAEFCLPYKPFYDRYVPHVEGAQLERWFHSRFREVQDAVVELPHARPFVAWCKERGFRMFVLTAVHKDHFFTQMETVGLTGFFEQTYVGAVDKRDQIHALLTENGLDPRETLFVGDMQHDIETAKHGGLHSCGVLTGYNSLDQLRQSEPHIIVEHLGELRGLLERHNGHYRPASGAEAIYPIVTVGALILNPEGHALMLRTHKWSNLWGIPGGKVRATEPAIDALKREVKEETNLEIDQIEFVLVQDCIGSREFYKPAHFVLLNYVARAAGHQDVILNDEAEEWRWVSPESALTELPLNTPTRILLEAVLNRRAAAHG